MPFLRSSFARISRVRRRQRQDTCLHVRLSITTYDEAQDARGTSVLRGPEWNGDREREMRSISSLCLFIEHKKVRRKAYV
jgi:hypothetical protein